MQGIQSLGVIFGLFMAYFIFLHYKRKEFSKIQFLFWELLWLSFIFIVIFPEITGGIVHKLGAYRLMDLLTILGFMFLTFLTFHNYAATAKMKRNLEELIRKEAVDEISKNESPTS